VALSELLSLGWFSSLGQALAAAEVADAEAYAAALGFVVPAHVVADWNAAARLIQSPRPELGWWEAERAEQTRLSASLPPNAPVELGAALAQLLHGAAAVAAARFGYAGAGMLRAAAGAAGLAAYQAELAARAGRPAQHPFALKLALFAAGRWPLGIYDNRVMVF
jgi:hypothetical protein